MRRLAMTLALVAAFSVTTPASAHWGQDRTFSRQLQAQIDDAASHGRISPRETVELREKLSSLSELERAFMPNGISGPEYAVLFKRSAALSKEIRAASSYPANRDDNQPMTWQSRTIDGHWIPDARFAGLHPGDRFSGDLKIGQRVTGRIVGMPDRYRSDYVDTDRVYYGYDNGRVYQIDSKSQIILALLDIMP